LQAWVKTRAFSFVQKRSSRFYSNKIRAPAGVLFHNFLKVDSGTPIAKGEDAVGQWQFVNTEQH
jgi:hypothetical protein